MCGMHYIYIRMCLHWKTLHPDQCCADITGVMSSEGQLDGTKMARSDMV